MSDFINAYLKQMIVTAISALIVLILFVAGWGFITAAIWIALADRYDCFVASLILGFGYIALSAIIMTILIVQNNKIQHKRETPSLRNTPQTLISAFLSGFEAARSRRRKNDRR